MPAETPTAAERQRRYRQRQAAGLAVLKLSVPCDLLTDLRAAGLIGEHADTVDPDLEDALVGLLHGWLAFSRDA